VRRDDAKSPPGIVTTLDRYVTRAATAVVSRDVERPLSRDPVRDLDQIPISDRRPFNGDPAGCTGSSVERTADVAWKRRIDAAASRQEKTGQRDDTALRSENDLRRLLAGNERLGDVDGTDEAGRRNKDALSDRDRRKHMRVQHAEMSLKVQKTRISIDAVGSMTSAAVEERKSSTTSPVIDDVNNSCLQASNDRRHKFSRLSTRINDGATEFQRQHLAIIHRKQHDLAAKLTARNVDYRQIADKQQNYVTSGRNDSRGQLSRDFVQPSPSGESTEVKRQPPREDFTKLPSTNAVRDSNIDKGRRAEALSRHRITSATNGTELILRDGLKDDSQTRRQETVNQSYACIGRETIESPPRLPNVPTRLVLSYGSAAPETRKSASGDYERRKSDGERDISRSSLTDNYSIISGHTWHTGGLWRSPEMDDVRQTVHPDTELTSPTPFPTTDYPSQRTSRPTADFKAHEVASLRRSPIVEERRKLPSITSDNESRLRQTKTDDCRVLWSKSTAEKFDVHGASVTYGFQAAAMASDNRPSSESESSSIRHMVPTPRHQHVDKGSVAGAVKTERKIFVYVPRASRSTGSLVSSDIQRRYRWSCFGNTATFDGRSSTSSGCQNVDCPTAASGISGHCDRLTRSQWTSATSDRCENTLGNVQSSAACDAVARSPRASDSEALRMQSANIGNMDLRVADPVGRVRQEFDVIAAPGNENDIIHSCSGVTESRPPYKPMFVSPLAVEETFERKHVVTPVTASLQQRAPLTNGQVECHKNDVRDVNSNVKPAGEANPSNWKGKSVDGGEGRGGKVIWNTDAWNRRGSLSARSMDAAPLSDRRSVTPEMFVELSAKIADLVMRQERLERASLQSLAVFPATATVAHAAHDVDSRLSNTTQASIATTSMAATTATASAVNSRVDFGVQVDPALVDADTAPPVMVADADPSTSANTSPPPSQRQAVNATDAVCSGALELERQRVVTVSDVECTAEKAQRSARSDDGRVTTPRVRICETVECIDDRTTTCVTDDDDKQEAAIGSGVMASSQSADESDAGRIDVGQVIHAVRGSVSLKDVSFQGHSVLVELKPLQSRARSVDDFVATSRHGCEKEHEGKSLTRRTFQRRTKGAADVEGRETNSTGRRSRRESLRDNPDDVVVGMNETVSCREDDDLTQETFNRRLGCSLKSCCQHRKVFRFDPGRRRHQLNLASSVSVAECSDNTRSSPQFRAVELDDETKIAACQSRMSRTKSPPADGAFHRSWNRSIPLPTSQQLAVELTSSGSSSSRESTVGCLRTTSSTVQRKPTVCETAAPLDRRLADSTVDGGSDSDDGDDDDNSDNPER
jgi:hypothetical protein